MNPVQKLVDTIGLTTNCGCESCKKLRDVIAEKDVTVNVPPGQSGPATFFGGTPVGNHDRSDTLPEPPPLVANAKREDAYAGADPHGDDLPLPVMTW